jgi:hypothetical protein
VCVSLIPHVPIIRSKEPASWKSMFAGFGFIFQKPVVLGAISLDLFAVVLGGADRAAPDLCEGHPAHRALGIGVAARGRRRSARSSSGSWIARYPIEQHVGRKLFVAVAIYGLAILVFAFSESFALSLVALGVSGAADMVSVVVRQTLVQVETPDAMRGRVSAVNAVFISTSNQLGEFRAGAHRGWFGVVGSVVFGRSGRWSWSPRGCGSFRNCAAATG